MTITVCRQCNMQCAGLFYFYIIYPVMEGGNSQWNSNNCNRITMRYTSLSFTTWMVIKHLTVTVAFVVDIAQLR